jgi:hypothetical protein
MIYKAKESYKKLSDDKNFNAFDSPSKHYRLINSEAVQISFVPKSLEKHLESEKVKKESK